MKLKITDATKQELLEYFFGFEGLGGGYRISADKDRFLIWLTDKRAKKMLGAMDAANADSHTALNNYIDNVRKMQEAEDIDEKLMYGERASKWFEAYENANKRADKLSEKVDTIWS